MSNWKRWSKQRSIKEDFEGVEDSSAKFSFSSGDEDYADDYEQIQQELFKSVFNKYPDESMQFFNGIAQRGDKEIESLLRKLQKDIGPTQSKEPDHPTDGDEIVPPEADTGFGGGEE